MPLIVASDRAEVWPMPELEKGGPEDLKEDMLSTTKLQLCITELGNATHEHTLR